MLEGLLHCTQHVSVQLWVHWQSLRHPFDNFDVLTNVSLVLIILFGSAACKLPCQNGGTCSASNVCSCRAGFEGALCQGLLCVELSMVLVDCDAVVTSSLGCVHGQTSAGFCSCFDGWKGLSCADRESLMFILLCCLGAHHLLF
jgi:hypothetical protein